jgi:transcriptional regulator with XRE-family HTH domain
MLDHYKVGNQIALLRKEKGLTGEKFAELLGVSPQAVSKWENGKCLPETALLPLISEIFETTIDALLKPGELTILNAVYSDGVKEINVTRVVNNHVNGDRMSIMVNPQSLGASLGSSGIGILLLKYQTPGGIFYNYAVQDFELTIDLSTEKHSSQTDFEILGAYYGNVNEFKSALQKIRHYDYFRWSEIHVNHENFPSSTGVDEPEYLIVVYLNHKGIHAVSCEENGTLCYSADKAELYRKDMSACVLPGIITLEWESGMDCTWAGAVYAALRYLGEPYTYEQIMGMSGACYRIAFTEVWDWSAADALVAFDYSDILFSGVGYEQTCADRVEKDGRNTERKRIVQSIADGKPVIAINLRIAPEWGVITGYKENGKTLLCRTYFDKEVLAGLNGGEEYLETDHWPFLMVYLGAKTEKPSESRTLLASLHALADSFEAPCVRGYYQGRQAYEKWIEGLKNHELWDAKRHKEDVDRRLSVNDYLLLNLIDARRCASKYLDDGLLLLDDEKEQLLSEIAGSYSEITDMLTAFRKKLKASAGEELRYNCVDTKISYEAAFRNEQAELLEKVLLIEEEIAEKAKILLM